MEKQKKLYIETYGCQMNFSDSQIVGSIMADHNYEISPAAEGADVIFLNTCSIRENAEQRVRKRLRELRSLKKKNPGLVIGLLGCMAERLKDKLFEEEPVLDAIVGPDAYRDLPRIMAEVEQGTRSVQVLLSREETYADINPVQLGSGGVSAFISIMRGCENHCAYCVVPFVRGRERSRDPQTIVGEARRLFGEGFREITLLGQNVNSYHYQNEGGLVDFAGLLAQVATIDPRLRVRFATSHPKDLSDQLIETIAAFPNICKSVHLPVQSGSTRILGLMNRKYTREWYMDRIRAIREKMPDCSVTTDIIAGFCSETPEDHQDTLSLMEWAAFDYAFMFRYSERPNTVAWKKYPDDVPEEVKKQRLEEIIRLQQKLSLRSNRQDTGKVFEVLVEGPSKRSPLHLSGRNSQNKMVVFPRKEFNPGDYVQVRVTGCTAATLLGEAVE